MAACQTSTRPTRRQIHVLGHLRFNWHKLSTGTRQAIHQITGRRTATDREPEVLSRLETFNVAEDGSNHAALCGPEWTDEGHGLEWHIEQARLLCDQLRSRSDVLDFEEWVGSHHAEDLPPYLPPAPPYDQAESGNRSNEDG
jgi:hypothetical protein